MTTTKKEEKKKFRPSFLVKINKKIKIIQLFFVDKLHIPFTDRLKRIYFFLDEKFKLGQRWRKTLPWMVIFSYVLLMGVIVVLVNDNQNKKNQLQEYAKKMESGKEFFGDLDSGEKELLREIIENWEEKLKYFDQLPPEEQRAVQSVSLALYFKDPDLLTPNVRRILEKDVGIKVTDLNKNDPDTVYFESKKVEYKEKVIYKIIVIAGKAKFLGTRIDVYETDGFFMDGKVRSLESFEPFIQEQIRLTLKGLNKYRLKSPKDKNE